MIKIESYNDYRIHFNNGTVIYYYHKTECCESNIADFSVLDNYTDLLKLEYSHFDIEPVQGMGFNLNLYRINDYGIPKKNVIFIPCYSYQNGYYSTDIEILVYDKDKVIREEHYLDCEWRSDW